MICKMYSEGKTGKEILKLVYPELKSENSIIKIAKDHGIKVQPRGQRPLTKNENYFEHINTEKKAYFIGLFITDGYIIKQPKTEKRSRHSDIVGISLKNDDKYIIEELKRELLSEVAIVDNRGCAQISFSSDKISNDLAKYGIVDNKSFKTYFPYNIDKEMWRHVIRGIFDGDGCITNNNVCCFYGNKKLLQDLQDILNQELGFKYGKITERKRGAGADSFSFSSKEAVNKFFHYIYDDNNICMERKYQKFLNSGYVKFD